MTELACLDYTIAQRVRAQTGSLNLLARWRDQHLAAYDVWAPGGISSSDPPDKWKCAGNTRPAASVGQGRSMAQGMTRGQALLAGMVAGAGVMLLMMPVYFWFPSSLFPRSWQLSSGPLYFIGLLYLIALFTISAFTSAKTGRVMVTAAGLWVGQIVFVLVLTSTFTIYLMIYEAGSNPQGIIFILALALPLITLFGVVVSLAGAWLGRAAVNSR